VDHRRRSRRRHVRQLHRPRQPLDRRPGDHARLRDQCVADGHGVLRIPLDVRHAPDADRIVHRQDRRPVGQPGGGVPVGGRLVRVRRRRWSRHAARRPSGPRRRRGADGARRLEGHRSVVPPAGAWNRHGHLRRVREDFQRHRHPDHGLPRHHVQLARGVHLHRHPVRRLPGRVVAALSHPETGSRQGPPQPSGIRLHPGRRRGGRRRRDGRVAQRTGLPAAPAQDVGPGARLTRRTPTPTTSCSPGCRPIWRSSSG